MAARGPTGARGGNNRFAQFKLVLLGESAVGKSSLVLRFVKDQFDDFRESTIGAAFLTQTISLDDNTTVKFEIWDTAGQERYKSLAPMYYRNANCAVVVYDITQASSLDKAKQWVKELQRQANENIIIALAGNKLDLVTSQPDKRAIATADAEAYAKEAGLLFFETSAKTSENVRELFTSIAKKLPLDQAGPRNPRSAGRGGVELRPENPSTQGQVSRSRMQPRWDCWAKLSRPKPASILETQPRAVTNTTSTHHRRSSSTQPVMLRAQLRSSTASGYRSSVANAGRQWHAMPSTPVVSGRVRGYADHKKPSITDSRPVVLPGSASDSTTEPLPPGPVPPTLYEPKATSDPPVGSSTAPPNVEVSDSALPTTPPPPPPPAPKPKRKFFRKFFTSIILLGALGYGGGIYYSRVNDNFHDFFTEYVPFGEDAVLYFEEKEFRKRFPKVAGRGSSPRETGGTVKIPSQSGVSWKVAEDTKPAAGRHADATKPDATKPKEALQHPVETKPEEKVKAVKAVKKEASPPAPAAKSPEPAKPAVEVAPSTKSSEAVPFTPPEVDEPSKFPPELARIDPLNVNDAAEPVVQDLVKIVNDIITVVNADNSSNKFSGTITKAKREISKVGAKINALKAAAEKDAEAKINAEKADFDRAAKELIRRVEAEMQHQQAEWQEEYQAERQKLQESYEQKLKAEVQAAQEVNEQRLRNSLLEQAVELKRKFTQDLQQRVEEERNGRLGKLSDLTKTVGELEKLTTDWNSVVDANLKTQHLHVAVEAVRSNLEKSQVPRPFTKELAALKEIASDDAVVNAAIASINPTAYQKGIPSSAQLIDRFRRVAEEVRKASLLPTDAGVASHASSYLLSKLLFKKKGLATGDDVESILTRTETLLEEGDLDGATREMNGLQGWAKTLSRDWLGEARKVLEVQQALDVIATEARLQSLRVE